MIKNSSAIKIRNFEVEKTKKRNKLVVIFIILIFSISLISYFVIINVFIIRGNIYYKINYDISVSNEEILIEKVETFNYSKYLDYSDYPGGQTHIDRDYIHFYKDLIDTDTGFHFNIQYFHHFIYNFGAENYSKVYLTYDNNTIFNATFTNGTKIFEIYWQIVFINFSILPYVYDIHDTIVLNDTILVKMSFYYVKYDEFTWAGYGIDIKQYVFLDQDFNVILACVPYILTFY